MSAVNQQNSIARDNFKNARVLIVEDNPDHAYIINKAIGQCLPEVKPVIVPTEAEALTYLAQCERDECIMPKLILLDLYLPDSQTGWRLLDELKTLPSAISKVPVVLLSSSVSRSDIREAYSRGCSSYLVKPGRFENWLAYFQTLRSYWWETVTLPKADVALF